MKQLRALRLFLALLGLLAFCQAANAACANPAGNAGDMTYSTSANVMAYCDGTNWVSMAGGVSLTVNTSGGGATPYGASGDVQINSSGALGGDTGNFKYTASTLYTPNLNVSGNVTASTVNASGLGTFGSILDNGGLTVLGAASMTTVSASAVSITTLQIGAGGTCTSGTAGAVRYNATSSTLDYCAGSAWISTGPSGTSVPAFSAYKTSSSNQTVPAGATTIITWSGKSFDTYNNFTVCSTNCNSGTPTAGQSRFTPSIAGYYYFTASLLCNTSATRCDVMIAKNGGNVARDTRNGATTYNHPIVTTLLYMNGSTDYVEAFGYIAGDTSFVGSNLDTYFTGTLVASGNGLAGGGGGTANPAGTTGDIQFNTGGLLDADTGSFYWDKTNHRLGIGTNAPAAALQVSGSMIVSTTGQNTLASASLAVDTRGVSVSSIVHITGSPISPIGAGGNAILSGSTAVSTSSAGSITFYAGGSQRMGMDSSGNLGIGTPSPTGPLDVYSSVTGVIRARGGTVTSYLWGAGAGIGAVGTETNHPFAIYTNASERMRIDSAGHMMINTTTPGAWLTINNTSAYSGMAISGYGNSIGYGIYLKPANDSGPTPIVFTNAAGTVVGSVVTNGTNTTYNTSSDRRVKENITESREGLQKLMEIGVKDFSFRADPSHTLVNGFIAQDLNKVYPEAVSTNGDNGETPLQKTAKPWSVDYGRVTPLIVKAVQDLKHLFDSEHDEILKLQVANDNLEKSLNAANDNTNRLLDEVENLKLRVRMLEHRNER